MDNKIDSPPDWMQQMVKLLTKQQKKSDVNIKDVYKRVHHRYPSKSFDKYFTINNILKYCNLSNPYTPIIDIIYNGIVDMVRSTKPIDIPVLVANKQTGTRGKIYYYTDNNKFEYQTVNKKKERQLHVRLCSLLRSSTSTVFSIYLNEMFDQMPDEIKLYFNNINLGKQKIYSPTFNCKHEYDTIAWYDFVCITDFNDDDEEEADACKLPGCKCWNTYTASEIYSIERVQHRYLNKEYFNYQNKLVCFNTEDEIEYIQNELVDYITYNKHFKKFITFLKMNNCGRQNLWSGGDDVTHNNIDRFMAAYNSRTTQLLTELEDDLNMEEIYENIVENKN